MSYPQKHFFPPSNRGRDSRRVESEGGGASPLDPCFHNSFSSLGTVTSGFPVSTAISQFGGLIRCAGPQGRAFRIPEPSNTARRISYMEGTSVSSCSKEG